MKAPTCIPPVTRRRRFPALPISFEGIAGAITVERVQALESDPGEVTLGEWDEARRVIRIIHDVTPAQAWLIYFHESGHAALSDSGVAATLRLKREENIVQAFAIARFRERFR